MTARDDSQSDLWQDGQALPTTHHTIAGSYQVRLEWRVIDGRPECDAIHINAPGVPIAAGDLRRLDLARLIRAQRAKIAAEHAGPPTGGLMRRSDRQRLDEVAQVYRKAYAEGQPPTKAVAEHFNVPRGTASAWVTRARAAGLLPPTSPGAPQG